MQAIQPLEIDVAAIHDVEGAGLRYQQVEDIDIVQLAVGDVDEARNAAAQIQQRVHLHRRLGRAEVRPREHRQAQVDGRGVQRVDRVGQFQAQVFAGVELSGLRNQRCAKSA